KPVLARRATARPADPRYEQVATSFHVQEFVMAIYMQLDGIKGDVEEAGHKDWIQLNSFQWGCGRGIGSPRSSASDRESSEAAVSEITVTKVVDEASTNLLRAALWGKGKKATIHFTRTGDD